MKRFWIALLVVAVILTGMQFGFAAGIEYIPGSRDKEGAVGVDGKSFEKGFINSNAFEGPTSNAFETYLSATDPTADRTILLPNNSGTISLTTDAFSGSLADGKILIGNNVGGGVAVAVTPSGLWDITNAGVATGILADGKIWIGNNVGGGDAVAVTMSGDATITNAGVLTIGNNKIGTAEFNVNSVDVTIAGSGTSGTATVTAGSTILGHYGVGNVYDIAINGITNVSIASTTLTVLINGTAGSEAVVHKVVVLEP
jgi:hypothetical protein